MTNIATAWKAPPCCSWENIHYFDWAMASMAKCYSHYQDLWHPVTSFLFQWPLSEMLHPLTRFKPGLIMWLACMSCGIRAQQKTLNEIDRGSTGPRGCPQSFRGCTSLLWEFKFPEEVTVLCDTCMQYVYIYIYSIVVIQYTCIHIGWIAVCWIHVWDDLVNSLNFLRKASDCAPVFFRLSLDCFEGKLAGKPPGCFVNQLDGYRMLSLLSSLDN